MKFQFKRESEEEKAVLLGLVTEDQTLQQLEEYLDELAFLAETAGAVAINTFYQKLRHPNTATYVGKGKLEEIHQYIKAKDIDMLIIDDEISPTQQRNLEKTLRIKVLDRSMLILDIFAQRAQTVQAKTQVELAQTQYLLPRLRGMWTHLDRIKGGIGMRGAGEKEIETDRRVAQKKISQLKKDLEKIDKQNFTRRKSRSGMIRVALVGYTNVGKSTLMNVLTKEDVFAEDKLFATLDTTVRKVVMENIPFLLSDTVGFIRKLPHHLIESFKSTLAESLESDILLHVVDISHPAFEDQMATVDETLQSLGIGNKETITVFNKMDKYKKEKFDPYLDEEVKIEILDELRNSWMSRTNKNVVFISATDKENIDHLRSILLEKVRDLYEKRYPYKAGY
ncbi:MAG: GTPase HflX [Chitinophagales bacterium]|nr:GTPase HflX [Chitinophagales bacterium]